MSTSLLDGNPSIGYAAHGYGYLREPDPDPENDDTSVLDDIYKEIWGDETDDTTFL